MKHQQPRDQSEYRHGPTTLSEDQRAVTEVLNYAFSFAIVFTVVIAVAVGTGSVIGDTTSQQATVTMVQNFEQFDDHLTVITDGGDAHRYRTEFPAGRLVQLPPTTIRIENTAGKVITLQTRPLYYETQGGQAVMYEAGFIASQPNKAKGTPAQIRSMPSEAHMGQRYVLPLAQLQHPSGGLAIGSTSALETTLELRDATPVKPPTATRFSASGGAVTIEVTTDIPSAWAAYLEAHPAFTIDSSRTSYTAGQTGTVVATATLSSGEQLVVPTETIYVTEATS